ncbi:MAG: ribonuclease III [Pseudomonadota bacterium]
MTHPDSDIDLQEMEKTIGYTFQDGNHLLSALTRRSYWHENRDSCREHNERMEFLGDAIMGLVIGEILYKEFPDAEEGDLQKKRASLVNRAAFARLARHLNVAPFIRMGRGDELSGCRDRDSILADTLEALVAAVYLDGGFYEAAEMIGCRFYPLLNGCSTRHGSVDYKSGLQELVQAAYGVTPQYRVANEWGEEHDKTFEVEVRLGENVFGRGIGRNKKEAAQNAAREALLSLEDMGIIEVEDPSTLRTDVS